MEANMLEQIQQMITTATDGLRQDFRQEISGVKTELRREISGMKTEVRQEVAAVRQEMAGMEVRLGGRIDEVKRHSGVLYEDLQHKLELVIEGQQFLRQDIANARSDMDAQTRETRTMIGAIYNQLNNRIDRHEQNHHT